MSHGKGVAPPFLSSSSKRKTGSLSTSVPKIPTARQKPQDLPPSEARQPSRTSPAASPAKRTKTDVQPDGPPKFVPKNLKEGTYAQHLFATLGSKFASEADTSSWFKASPSENADAAARCMAEAFIRQASLTQGYKALEKKVTILEYSKEQDRLSLEKTFKADLQRETASLRTDLKNAKKERNDFEKQFAEAQELAKKAAEEAKAKHDEELAKLRGELEAKQLELDAAEDKYLAQGQVSFMKGFIRKIPDFDWDKLGEGNADFAASLLKEIEAEDAEEERLAAETNQDAPPS